jgi:tetratricopeptide (TPR) repeat protein
MKRALILALLLPTLSGALPQAGTFAFAQEAALQTGIVDEGRRREALQHYRDGQEHLYSEAWEEAEREFLQAIKIDPLLTLAHYGLGQAYMGMKRYGQAVKAYIGCREAIHRLAMLSQSHEVAVDRIREQEIRELQDTLRAVRGGQVKASEPQSTILRLETRLRDLERTKYRTVSGQPETPAEVSLALGSAYFRNGSVPDAEREYQAAIKANSKMGEAHNNLAVVYMMTGRLGEAESHIKLAERAGFRVNPQFKADLKARRSN